MSSQITVTVDGARRSIERGTRIRDVLLEGPRKIREIVAAKLDGKVVDLSLPLNDDAAIEPILTDSPEGVDVLRHSTAHLMAMAVQALYPGTEVTIGPVIEDGFFYDFAPKTPFTVDDLPKIEAKMKELAKADLRVYRSEMPRAEAIEKFRAMGEKYKVEIIEGIPEATVSIYSQGEWMDLCRGPHVPSTGYIKAFKLTSVAGAYWRGDEHNAMLSRIYGTSFATKDALEEHLKLVELAKQRDHRKLGREMGLYFFDPISPGSPFFLPRGAVIYNELIGYMRRLYRRYGFTEVISPQIFRNQLFHTSGHWEFFRENMFLTPDPDSDKGNAIDTSPEGWRSGYGVKPMNCPGHHVMYRSEKRSYRELPIRFADFGRLHRNELSGTLHGLDRVRSLTQDDAHIYCTEDQVESEVDANLQMVRDVYTALGFDKVEFKVATMPTNHMGTEEQWRANEAKLGNALTRNGYTFEINPGEGAFYGPKIEIYVPDALKRKWQVATIQLDYSAPERFDLTYSASSGAEERPVIIHRAILGSVERFIGVLIEHTGGVLPFWLAPEQVRVLSLSEKVEAYALELTSILKKEGMRAEADVRNEKLGFKVRDAEMQKIPYMVVVGEREAESRSVSVRLLRGAKAEAMSIDDLISRLQSEPLPS
ncbi:MAG TPA: threonine--tRNA ligase [Candidatus Binataceae bacterium]|nr:threonine--tRNA ligase [Candidatus Binataceae bacterium]